METRDVIFSIVMVISSFVLTYSWLGRFKHDPANALIILSAMILVGALALMLLSIDIKLRKIDTMIDAKERSLRVNIQSIENETDKKMGAVINKLKEVVDVVDQKRYR